MFEFKILKKSDKTRARTGVFATPHGELHTPELAIVATEGEVKSLPHILLPSTSIRLLIVNTFHIYTKKILPKIENVKGIHDYSNFPRVIASDSGGFQVFSLGFGMAQGVGKVANIFPGETLPTSDENNPVKITEEGVTFVFDGKELILNPEKSMEIQHRIGADIMFAFDECTSPLNSKTYNEISLERTHRWLERSITAHKDYKDNQALFGIVQGAYFQDLRKKASEFLAKYDVPGYGIGGTLGKTKEDMRNVLDWSIPYLPEEKPRHLLGIGQVRDIFESVERGVDLFDCVIPTREARHKILYTKRGRLNVKKMKNLNEKIETDCDCQACQEGISYSQLDQLFRLKDSRAYLYSTLHNIQFFTNLMKEIRESIEFKKLSNLKDDYFKYY